MSLHHIRPFVLGAGLWITCAVVIGCSSEADEPPSRAAAVDSATDTACDWYERCGLIGAGKAYATRDSCDAQTRAQWDSLWSASDCEGRIDSTQLDACVKAIQATECQSALDAFNTLVSKCPQSKVCA
jgi:hypothetical protein